MMRLQGLLGVAALLGSVVVVVACSATPTTTSAPTANGTDSGAKKPDSTTVTVIVPVDSAEPRVCPETCTANGECANSCESVASGSWCCDTTARECYRASENICPVPTREDAGRGSIY